MEERGSVYEDLTDYQKNIFDITWDGEKSVEASLVDQSAMSPAEALRSGQYTDLIAGRVPKDHGRKYVVFIVDSSDPSAVPEFIGVVMMVDGPKRKHWNNIQSRRTYNFLGYVGLEWLLESSPELQRLLPPGWSGDPERIGEGRPGALLMSEDTFNFYNNRVKMGMR